MKTRYSLLLAVLDGTVFRDQFIWTGWVYNDYTQGVCCHSHRPSDSLRIPAFFLVDDSGDKLKVLGRYYP